MRLSVWMLVAACGPAGGTSDSDSDSDSDSGSSTGSEDPLFEVDGVYELVTYDLDGSGFVPVNSDVLAEGLLMRVDSAVGVAQVAMCAESESDTPANSQCRLAAADDTAWFCGCFAYAFEGNEMVWRPFAAGEPPPQVMFPAQATDTLVSVAEVLGRAGAFAFAPLPAGVFGSDGAASRYEFEPRPPTTFDQVFDDPEGRAPCEPCVTP